MILIDITGFVGHLHPIMVHLPIGFLMLAILFEFVSYFKKYQQLKAAVSFTLLLGFASAVVACVSGYTLSLTGDYDFYRLSNHKIAGITVALVSGLLYFMTTVQVEKVFPVQRRFFSMSFVVLFVLLMYTGHQGGSLTHGTDYISLKTLTKHKFEKPATVEEALLFENVVHPILDKRCSQCHREGKRKGKLSMETLADLFKGGKSGPAVTAGKLTDSELYKRITLDDSNEKFMPADGKTPLTKGETAIIKWWIEKGMAGEGKKISELKDAEEIKLPVAVFLGLAEANEDNALTAGSSREVNAAIPSVFNLALADSLRTKGVSVRVMLHQPVMLDVTLPPGSGKIILLIKSDLQAVAKNIIWLNLSENGLTEKDLDFLPLMTNLEKLRLEKNPIGDGISNHLAGLHHLEAVNLNETKVTASCIEKLKQIPSLKRIYSWKAVVD